MQQVTVQLFNGIGNQLFQYAAGRWLASQLGVPLRLVSHATEGDSVTRPLLIQQFAIRHAVEPMTALDRLAVSTRPRYHLASRMLRAASRVQVLRQDPTRIAEPFDFEIDSGARTLYLSGYFQEYELVREVASLLRREFVLKNPLGASAQAYADRIRATRRPISVHVRRGDYLTTFGPRGVLPMSYYERAIEHMQRQFPDARFFVFSDDPAFAKFWARSYPRMTVVEASAGAEAHESLHLMSLCRHHIVANSTFSWWGAWLNARADRQVVAPDRWLGSNTAATPIACPDWQLLPADRPIERRVPDRMARRA
jgi:Glycosyl transferase family 11